MYARCVYVCRLSLFARGVTSYGDDRRKGNELGLSSSNFNTIALSSSSSSSPSSRRVGRRKRRKRPEERRFPKRWKKSRFSIENQKPSCNNNDIREMSEIKIRVAHKKIKDERLHSFSFDGRRRTRKKSSTKTMKRQKTAHQSNSR